MTVILVPKGNRMLADERQSEARLSLSQFGAPGNPNRKPKCSGVLRLRR
jgi:hypothetical protein